MKRLWLLLLVVKRCMIYGIQYKSIKNQYIENINIFYYNI